MIRIYSMQARYLNIRFTVSALCTCIFKWQHMCPTAAISCRQEVCYLVMSCCKTCSMLNSIHIMSLLVSMELVMLCYILLAVLLPACCLSQQQNPLPQTFPAVVSQGHDGVCPSAEESAAITEDIFQQVEIFCLISVQLSLWWPWTVD